MRNPLNKRVARIFVKEPTRHLPLFILILITIVIISSFFIVQGSIRTIYYDHLEKGKAEDGQFTTVYELSDKTRKKIEAKDIELYENFYVELKSGKADLNIYKVRKDINIQNLISGRLPDNPDEIALDNNYILANKYKLGDRLEIGKKNYKLVGSVVLPDYIAMMRSRNDVLMSIETFGVGLLSSEGFDKVKDEGVQYSYSYLMNKKPESKKASNDKLKEVTKLAFEDNVLTDAVTRDQNKRISYLIDDMGGDVPTMYTVLILAMLSIAFVFTMQTRNLIESEAGAIGTLKASGYSKWELIRHYMLLPTVSVVLAGILGNILAYTKSYEMYQHTYYESFSLPTFTPLFNARAFLITTLIPTAVIILINFIMLANKLKLGPLRFLRRDFRKKADAGQIDLPNFSFLWRYRIKVLLVNKLNVLVLLFGVTLAGVFLTFGLGMLPMFTKHTKMMMDEFPAKYQSFVRAEIPDIKGEKFAYSSFEINADGTAHPFDLYGIQKDSRYFDKEVISSLGDGEVMASQGLVEKFKLKIGDRINVVNPYTGREVELTIAGTRKRAVSLTAYMSIEGFNKLMGYEEAYFSGYYTDSKPHAEDGIIVSSIDRDMVGKMADHFMDTFRPILNAICFISVFFYFVFVYLLSKNIIDKSGTEIAYLKIFGFKNRESTGIYLDATGLILAIYFLFLPLILKHLMHFLVEVSIKKLDTYITPYFPAYVYPAVIVTGIVIFLASLGLQMVKISRISMVETLKDING